MASRATRTRSPLLTVAAVAAFTGAALLLLAPVLPIAQVEVLGESVDVRPGIEGWGIVAAGLVAAALAVLALRTRRAAWMVAVALPGLVAIGWSGWYAFVRLPGYAALADDVSFGWGGIAFLVAGPLLIGAAAAALLAGLDRG